ncbi:restriction endonuclease subunit S [Flavobacterium sp.]|uniref:restriction endonuclease subunit S n=1 Tax=Flavobacterium sp. TaxID=239 RepID=UPI002487836F|nr:restriction endonuclease subunit S [Flavobacterium sp.]MDI1317903.1 restriction endonuclease subunit S [Flavobacterium sp.]
MSWELKKIGICLDFYNGKTIKVDNNKGENPIYGSNGIIGSSSKFNYNDSIIVGRVGAYCGAVKREKGDFWATDNTIVVKSKLNNDNDFWFYLLQNSNLNNYAGGSAQPLITQGTLKELEFQIPSFPTQKRIASILSAYDDLIENNLKRIKLLEETAQNIYKEWFVHFRFPNYESMAFDGESGLPVGWEMTKMDEVMQISGGGTPSTKEPNYWDGEILWFSPTDLGKNTSLILLDSSKKITNEGLSKSSAKLLPPMTILMSSRATIGLFGMLNKECSTNQGFINIIPNNVLLRYYILFNLIYRKHEIEANASGTTFKEISKGVFKNMDIVEPNSDVANDFFKLCDNIFKQVENIEIQNQKLKEARDILLPRLMNRTIEV